MSDLNSLILSVMSSSDNNKLAIVVDGRLLMYRGKMVYAKVESSNRDTPVLELFVKGGSGTGTADTEDVPMSLLLTALRNTPTLETVIDHGVYDNDENISIKVVNSLNLLVCESSLYYSVRLAAEAEDSGEPISGIVIGDTTISGVDLRRLISTFREEAYRVYGDLVYSAGHNRFVNRLLKYNRFYDVMKSFVPVFIDFTAVYNPFRSKTAKVEMTKMYQMAVEKNRKITCDNDLSCYVLTHEEICKAFEMSRFMRFTSSYWYSVFVGLLRPGLAGFPRKSTQGDHVHDRIFVINRAEAEAVSLKSRYTPTAYFHYMKSLEDAVKKATEEGKTDAANTAEKKLKVLHSYSEFDTLYFSCVENLTRLTTFGPYQIDEKKISAADLYSIIMEARLGVVMGA